MSAKRDRVILPLLSRSESTVDKLVFDIPSLFLHLLLFDAVIVPTVRLLDVAAIFRAVGFKQTMELFEAGCLYLRSGAENIGTYADLPPDVVRMVYFQGDPDLTLANFLPELSNIETRKKNRDALKAAVTQSWLPGQKETPYMLEAMETAHREAIELGPTFMAALELQLAEARLPPLTRDQVHVEAQRDESLKFRLDGVDGWTPALSRALRNATAGVAELEGRFGHMDRDNAVGGIREAEQAIMERKVQSLWQEIRPNERVEQFYRVQSIANLPYFADWFRDPGLDMKAFLKVRETSECREFRAFLNSSASMDDTELLARTVSLRGSIGGNLGSGVGKALRWLGTTALGLIPVAGIVLGPAASAADTFLVEKIFPSKGIISFVGSQYPSIFK